MQPFFFGDADEQLLGVYHAPEVYPARDLGIVLCYPWGHEGDATMRVCRMLAGRLAKVGFHVLRFDYYGTGDSAGEREDGDIDQWTRDVATAVDELRSSRGVLRIGLVGLRLGATLACLAASHRTDVEGLVLWEPIVDGKSYADGLRALHRNWLRGELDDRPGATKYAGTGEALGYPLADRLTRSLERTSLLALDDLCAKKILIVGDDGQAGDRELGARLVSRGANLDRQQTDALPTSPRDAQFSQVQVPGRTLDLIVTWLSGVVV